MRDQCKIGKVYLQTTQLFVALLNVSVRLRCAKRVSHLVDFHSCCRCSPSHISEFVGELLTPSPLY